MAKSPSPLERLLEAISARVKDSNESPPSLNPADDLINGFVETLKSADSQIRFLLAQLSQLKDIEPFAPHAVCEKIDARGHDALAGAELTSQQAIPVATALYRLLQDDAWLKWATYYTDLNKHLSEAHSKRCGPNNNKPEEIGPAFQTHYGKKTVGSA